MKKVTFILIFLAFALQTQARSDVFDLIQDYRAGRVKPQNVKLDNQQIRKVIDFIKPRLQSSFSSQSTTYRPKPFNIDFKNLTQSLYTFTGEYDVVVDTRTKTPRFVFPKISQNLVSSKYQNFVLSNAFYGFIKNNSQLFGIDQPEKHFIEKEIIRTSRDEVIVLYEQVYNRIPIWGKEIIATYNAAGELKSIVSNYIPIDFQLETTSPRISSQAAILKAREKLVANGVVFEDISIYKSLMRTKYPISKLYIYAEKSFEKPRLVWMVELMPNIYQVYRFFVDAVTGEILEYYRANPSDGPTAGTGRDLFNQVRNLNIFKKGNTYYLVDASKPMYNNNNANPNGVIVVYTNNNQDLTSSSVPAVVSSQTNYFDDQIAVSAFYHFGLVYDYYHNTHGWNSIDGKGKNIIGIVHVTEKGMPMQNAYWNGELMVFGSGGDIFFPFSRALDVIAHEFTHGVVQYSVDLEYKFQSGALNEAFADWGGAMVDRDDWYIGEDLVYPQYFPMGARNMEDPHNGFAPGNPNWLPAHMNEYQNLPLERDNGGVHINVGIINKATYLIGNSIGKDKLEKIYFRVLEKRYLTKQANFVDFRVACERSAKELFGDNSPELNAVRNAFDAVGIGQSGGSSPSPDLPPVVGQNFILAVDQQFNYLYLMPENLQSQNQIVKISDSPLMTTSGSTYTVSEDGSFILYIDNMSRLHGIDLINKQDTLLLPGPVFRSIALSGGTRPKLAITTLEYRPQIIILDILTEESTIIDLIQPNTSHTGGYLQPLVAVNLSWSPDGRILVYDAINIRQNALGDTSYYAEINALDAESKVIYRLLPPLPEGFHVASPRFSQTRNDKIAFVVYDENSLRGYVILGDLYSGNLSFVVTTSLNQYQPATPTFSPTDQAIAFQVFSPLSYTYFVYRQYLNADKFTPLGQPELFLQNAGMPYWFAIGLRSSVDLSELVVGNDIFYPNPFVEQIYVDFGKLGLNSISSVKLSNINFSLNLDLSWQLIGDKLEIKVPEHLPPGLYFIEISDLTKKKFIKGIKL